jgi:hypothetical protein
VHPNGIFDAGLTVNGITTGNYMEQLMVTRDGEGTSGLQHALQVIGSNQSVIP